MKTHHKIISALIIGGALLAVGCHRHTIIAGEGGNTEGEAASSEWASHWFFGVIGDTEVNVKEICPSGNATVKDGRSFLVQFVSLFTGIVWSPSNVTVYCGEGAKQSKVDVSLSAEEVAYIAHDPRFMAWAKSVDSHSAHQLEAVLDVQPSAANSMVAKSTSTSQF